MAYRKALPGATTRGMIAPAAGLGPQPKSQQQSEQEAQDLLASFGSRILEMLRAGGKKLENMDNRYADAVYDRLGGQQANPLLGYTSSGRLGEMIRGETGGDLGVMAQKYGAIGANLASRYALPAGGVTLAGKGIGDIIAALSSDETEERY